MKSSPMKNPLVVALDVDSMEEAVSLATSLKDVVGGFKIGPRLNLRYGQSIVQNLSQMAPVFVDNKHYDIPSTMESAVRASFEAGASIVTVHAQSGKTALRAMAKLESELSSIRPFKIAAVTILTSWGVEDLPSNFAKIALDEQVVELVNDVVEAGLGSIVCSPHELVKIQQDVKKTDLFFITPGIRGGADPVVDQKRTASPEEALQNGASILVVGRPILKASNPSLAAKQILGV